MSSIAQALCVFCAAYSTAPTPPLSREADGIRYTHEIIGGGKHLLRLSTGYSLFDGDDFNEQRMAAFATYVASTTCPRRFVFETRRGGMPTIRPVLAKSFVFRCRR